jgi:hypothetical protein
MAAPEVDNPPPDKKSKDEEPQHYRPLFPDLGDKIHIEDMSDAGLDSAQSGSMFYHADDSALSHLPKNGKSSKARNTLAIVGAIGGTVTLLGVGAYAIRQALQNRKPPKPPESPPEQEPE